MFEIIDDSVLISGDDSADYEAQWCGCKPANPGDVTCLDSRCTNFAIQVECKRCGPSCGNNRLQRKAFHDLEVKDVFPKGKGVFAKTLIRKGDLVHEFMGEIVSAKDLRQRVSDMNDREEQHMYVMQLRSKTFVDARHKGAVIRYLNHSCEPNCDLEVWSVNGHLRLGIFATKDIVSGEELSADYQWELSGRPPTRCYCKTPSCRGFLEVFKTEDIANMLSRRGTWTSCQERFVMSSNVVMNNSNSIFDANGALIPANFVGKYVKIWYDDTKQFLETRVEEHRGGGVYLLLDVFRNYTFEDDLETINTNWYYLDETQVSAIKKKESSTGPGTVDDDTDDENMLKSYTSAIIGVNTDLNEKNKRSKGDIVESTKVSHRFRVRYKLACFLTYGAWNERGAKFKTKDLSKTAVKTRIVSDFGDYLQHSFQLTSRRVGDTALDAKHPSSFECEVGGEQEQIQQLKRALVTAHDLVKAQEESHTERLHLDLWKTQGEGITCDWVTKSIFARPQPPHQYPILASMGLSTSAAADEVLYQQLLLLQEHILAPRGHLLRDLAPHILQGTAASRDHEGGLAEAVYEERVALVGKALYALPRPVELTLYAHLVHILRRLQISRTCWLPALVLLTRYLPLINADVVAVRESVPLLSALIVIVLKCKGYFKVRALKRLVKVTYAQVFSRDEQALGHSTDSFLSAVLDKENDVYEKLRGDCYVVDTFPASLFVVKPPNSTVSTASIGCTTGTLDRRSLLQHLVLETHDMLVGLWYRVPQLMSGFATEMSQLSAFLCVYAIHAELCEHRSSPPSASLSSTVASTMMVVDEQEEDEHERLSREDALSDEDAYQTINVHVVREEVTLYVRHLLARYRLASSSVVLLAQYLTLILVSLLPEQDKPNMSDTIHHDLAIPVLKHLIALVGNQRNQPKSTQTTAKILTMKIEEVLVPLLRLSPPSPPSAPGQLQYHQNSQALNHHSTYPNSGASTKAGVSGKSNQDCITLRSLESLYHHQATTSATAIAPVSSTVIPAMHTSTSAVTSGNGAGGLEGLNAYEVLSSSESGGSGNDSVVDDLEDLTTRRLRLHPLTQQHLQLQKQQQQEKSNSKKDSVLGMSVLQGGLPEVRVSARACVPLSKVRAFKLTVHDQLYLCRYI